MDRVRRIELLVRAAEAGSFARAAKLLDLDPSAVSHAIAELEKELRVTLFYRTTRQLRLTEDGEEIVRRGREILREIAELESVAAEGDGRLTGTLRVGMHVPISRHVIMPRLPEFMRRHPELRLECLLLAQVKDLHAAGLDVLVRAGEPPEVDLVARKLAEMRRRPTSARLASLRLRKTCCGIAASFTSRRPRCARGTTGHSSATASAGWSPCRAPS